MELLLSVFCDCDRCSVANDRRSATRKEQAMKALRILEYEGPEEWLRVALSGSIRGMFDMSSTTEKCTIRELTRIEVDEIMTNQPPEEPAYTPITMRQLLDVLKTATEAERREFSTWWAGLPITERWPPLTVNAEPKINEWDRNLEEGG